MKRSPVVAIGVRRGGYGRYNGAAPPPRIAEKECLSEARPKGSCEGNHR